MPHALPFAPQNLPAPDVRHAPAAAGPSGQNEAGEPHGLRQAVRRAIEPRVEIIDVGPGWMTVAQLMQAHQDRNTSTLAMYETLCALKQAERSAWHDEQEQQQDRQLRETIERAGHPRYQVGKPTLVALQLMAAIERSQATRQATLERLAVQVRAAMAGSRPAESRP